MLVVTGAGLLSLMRRQGVLGRTARLGAAACVVGLATLAAAVVLQSVFFGDDFELMPWFVGPGVLALALGIALLGWAILRSGVLPGWSGISLLVGAALLLGANEQTSAVLLAVPFGLAWMAAGVALLRQRSEGTAVTQSEGAHPDQIRLRSRAARPPG
jgi:hypothetical protein